MFFGFAEAYFKQRAKGYDQSGESRLIQNFVEDGRRNRTIVWRINFDADNDGNLPDTVDRGSSFVLEPYTANIDHIGDTNGDQSDQEILIPFIIYPNGTIGLPSTGIGAVPIQNDIVGSSPILRSQDAQIFQGQFITMIRLFMVNNQPINGNRSSLEGVFDVSLLPGLRLIDFQVAEVSCTEIINFPSGLETIRIGEARNLTRFDKLPENLLGFIALDTDFIAANFNTIIANCSKIQHLQNANLSLLPRTINLMNENHPANIDISHCTELRNVILGNNNDNNGIQSIDFPRLGGNLNMPNLEAICIFFCGYNDGNTLIELIDDYSTQLRTLEFLQLDNQTAWTRNLSSLDIDNINLIFFAIANCAFNGNVIFDIDNVIEHFMLSNATLAINAGNNQIVDLSGCKNSTEIMMNTVNCFDLELPILNNPATLINLYIEQNPLDIATNPTLVSRIESYTSLINAYINNGNTVFMNLGNVLDLSNFIRPTTIRMTNSSLQTIILPSVKSTLNDLRVLAVDYNSNLTSVQNLSVNDEIDNFNFINCILFNPDFSELPFIRSSIGRASGITVLDLSSRTSTLTISNLDFQLCPNLTTVILPANSVNAQNLGSFTFASCNITSIQNFNNVTQTGTQRNFNFANNPNLNQSLDFTNRYFRTISLQNCAFDQTNVDLIVDNLYLNRVAHTAFNPSNITFNISGGTNASPTGIFQAPSGFVLGSNDGTPASPQERIFVLVNNYNWVITTN